MTDKYESFTFGANSVSEHAFNVAPNDNADLPFIIRTFRVSDAGDVTVIDVEGNTLTFRNVQPGEYPPLRISRILSAGTSATGIIGFV